MAITVEEATRFFNWVEKLSTHDGKITRADLEKAVAVDVDGDGLITDIPQPRGDGTYFTENEIVTNNVAAWITNAGTNWSDQAITLTEFLAML